MDTGRGVVMAYAAIIGAVLVLLGILGFFGNPIVGDPARNPIFVTGTVHNLVLLISGSLAWYVALGLRGDQQVAGVMGIGVLFVAISVLTVASANLFGLLSDPVNAADHVLHLGIAVASIAVGWFARGSTGRIIPAR